MAFSFSPGQIAPQGSQAAVAPGTVAPGTAISPVQGEPSTSPLLILRERSEGKPISIMACVQLILTVIAILSVITSAILYSYMVYLSSNIEKQKTLIGEKDAQFKTYPIDEMQVLSVRFALLDTALKSYISPRSPLKFLEDVVENQVYFDDFSLTQTVNGAGYVVEFSVITNNYRALIQQLESLNLKEYSKVAPKPLANNLSDAGNAVKIKVSTPIFVQGVLPDEIVFLDPMASSTSTPAKPATATSTP